MKSNIVSEILASPSYPSYAVSTVSGQYVVVGGGGGAAKTGIKNQFDVYKISHNGKKTESKLVFSHDVGDACVSNLTAWVDPTSIKNSWACPKIHIAYGQEDKCEVDLLIPSVNNVKESSIESGAGKKGVSARNRFKNVEVNSKENIKPRTKMGNTGFHCKTLVFVKNVVTSVETVKSDNDDSYQKVVRISSDNKLLVTGGTDGNITIWDAMSMERLKVIKAHIKDVDDVDYRGDNKYIVSVCKPTKECSIWDADKGSLHMHLTSPNTNNVKYKFYKARYGTVEGNIKEPKLFTVCNAVYGSKNPGIIIKWNGLTYAQEKQQALEGVLSSLSISNNGRYVATGTMDGSVHILISFSLQVLNTINNAHNVFVTGLEWLPVGAPNYPMIQGFSEASVISVSCDNKMLIHHIPERQLVPVWVVAMLAAVVLIVSFLLANLFGL